MPTADAPRCSIIVPNYKTEAFTRLCLRSLRKYSRLNNEVIVVDNNSADVSLDYLRTLPWIKLVENKSTSLGSMAHREALDLGVTAAAGEWIVFFHSDTIVLRGGWDKILIEKAEREGAVGFSSALRNIDGFEPGWRKLLNRIKDGNQESRAAKPGEKIKLMSYCFGIRGDIFKRSGYSFRAGGDPITDFYNRVIAGKHPFLLLDRAALEPLLWHGSNVTSLATQQMTDRKSISRFSKKSERLLQDPEIQSILTDETLDR